VLFRDGLNDIYSCCSFAVFWNADPMVMNTLLLSIANAKLSSTPQLMASELPFRLLLFKSNKGRLDKLRRFDLRPPVRISLSEGDDSC
jgi:hypothetical protein